MTRIIRILLLATLLAVALVAGFRPAYAACGGTTVVNTTAELNAAIDAFNSATGPCDFTIQLAGTIDLDDDVTQVYNATAGTSLTIDGQQNFSLNGGASHALLTIYDTNVTLQDLTLVGASGNALTFGASSSYAVGTLRNVVIINSAGVGLLVLGSEVTAERLTVAGHSGGGANISGGSTVDLSGAAFHHNTGFGLVVDDSSLTLTDSTISGNFSTTGLLFTSPDGDPLTIINSTIAEHNDGLQIDGGTTRLTHVTITGNSQGMRLASYSGDATAVVNNSIIAGNDGSDCYYSPGAFTVTGQFYFSLLRFTDYDACDLPAANPDANGNIVGVDPFLGPLSEDYGGFTATVPPRELTGNVTYVSPAINAADPGRSVDKNGDPLAFDQRGDGFARVVGDAPDMGAFEGTLVTECPNFPVAVDAAHELNTAIFCYNYVVDPGAYTITLADDILLSAATQAVDNPTPGVSLVIDGGGNTIDGQDIEGARPLTFLEGSVAQVFDLTVRGGNSVYGDINLNVIPGAGGGINNGGSLELERVNVVDNYAEGDGGGIFNYGDLTVRDSTLGGNEVGNSGGGLANQDQALLFNTLVLENTALPPSGDGGGIYNRGFLVLAGSTVAGNAARGDETVVGGGIYNRDTLELFSTTVRDNQAEADESDARGGGIYNTGNLVARNSLVAFNSASAPEDVSGGGIFSRLDDLLAEDEDNTGLHLINTTLSGNTAESTGATEAAGRVYGGGLFVEAYILPEYLPLPDTVTLTNVTIAGNGVSAPNATGDEPAGGGAYFNVRESAASPIVRVNNTIMAGNGDDCVLGAALDFASAHSLYESSGAAACDLAAADPDANGNIVGEDALLGPLANNGGPTRTHALLAGSPAIDSGDNDLAVNQSGDPLADDQRGFFDRVENGTVDMGAYEVGAQEPSHDDGGVFFSATAVGSAAGLAFGPHDILRYDGSAWSKWFDGTAAGLKGTTTARHNINAFWFPDSGDDDVVMSFAQNGRRVPDITGRVDGMDLVQWNGHGFTLLFDGQDVGLADLAYERIDGLHVLDGSNAPPALVAAAGGSCQAYLLVSTQGPGRVLNYDATQLRFGGEDVLGFCLTQSGATTQGKWILALDGSAEGMPRNSTDSISVSDDLQTLYLTTKGAFAVDGASGSHSMVYEFSFGTGQFSGPILRAADEGLNRKVDGLQVE